MAIGECASVLIMDVEKHSTSKSSRSHALRIISENTWRDLVTDLGANASFLGVQLGGSYQEFEHNRRNYFQLNQSNESAEEAEFYFKKSLAPGAVQAWRDCMLKQNGFSCFSEIYHESPELIAVTFLWRATAAQPQSISVTNSQVIGGRAKQSDVNQGQAVPDGQVFHHDAPLTFFYEREFGASFWASAQTHEVGSPDKPVYVSALPVRVLMWDAVNDSDIHRVEALFKAGFGINQSIDLEGNRALHLAAERAAVGLARFLLKQPGIELQLTNSWGDAPLAIAEAKHTKMSKIYTVIEKAIKETP